MNLKTILITVVSIIVLVLLASTFISFSNREIDLRVAFNQKASERVSFYDKMYKILSQKTQIAVKNDSSFKEVVNAQVQGQKNGEQVMWAWVQQSNPTATYSEVTKLYQELSRTVEGERNGFFEQEKFLQDIKRQHDALLNKFPGSFYNLFLNRKELPYKPIQATLTEQVFKTGKDDNIKLEL